MEVQSLDQRLSAALGVLSRISGVRAARIELHRVDYVVLSAQHGDVVPWPTLFAVVDAEALWADAAIDAGSELALVSRSLSRVGEVLCGIVISKTSPGTKSMRRSMRLAVKYLDPDKKRIHAPPRHRTQSPDAKEVERVDPWPNVPKLF